MGRLYLFSPFAVCVSVFVGSNKCGCVSALRGWAKVCTCRYLPVVIEESSLAQDVHAVYEMEHIHLLEMETDDSQRRRLSVL